jgi:hypothetical protein
MTGAAAVAALGGSVGIAVSLTPELVTGNSTAGGTVDIPTSSTVATVEGGIGGLTYSWAQVDVSPYVWTISAPAAANTYFTAFGIPEGINITVIFELTVTDAAGNKGTAQVMARVRNKTDFDPPPHGSGRFFDSEA